MTTTNNVKMQQRFLGGRVERSENLFISYITNVDDVVFFFLKKITKTKKSRKWIELQKYGKIQSKY